MASNLFYAGEVQSGVTPSARLPLVPKLPALIYFDSRDGAERSVRESYANTFEAQCVVEMVNLLLQNDVAPDEIGVISQYKAQVDELSQLLEARLTTNGIGGLQVLNHYH